MKIESANWKEKETREAGYAEAIKTGLSVAQDTTDVTQAINQLRVKMDENSQRLKKELEENQEERVRELKDEDERKNNIVIFGVPEVKGSGGEQQAADSLFFNKLVKETLEVDLRSNSVRRLTRLGKVSERADKP